MVPAAGEEEKEGMVSRMRVIAALAAFGMIVAAHGQVLLTGVNPTYTQNFNTLPSSGTSGTWANNSTLVGWYAFRYGASGSAGSREGTDQAFSSLVIGTGSSNNGGLYSYGSASAVDRALGTLPSGGTGDFCYGIALTNSTGVRITSFTFSYTGEQWRNGGNTTGGTVVLAHHETIVFEWKTTSSFVASTDFNANKMAGVTSSSEASFTSLVANASPSALNGNDPANRTVGIGLSNVAVSLNPGETLVLRWWDDRNAGNNQGLAIDDFEFSAVTEAVPEPFTMLLGAAGLALAVRRRNRR